MATTGKRVASTSGRPGGERGNELLSGSQRGLATLAICDYLARRVPDRAARDPRPRSGRGPTCIAASPRRWSDPGSEVGAIAVGSVSPASNVRSESGAVICIRRPLGQRHEMTLAGTEAPLPG